jgi:hypothetical protein
MDSRNRRLIKEKIPEEWIWEENWMSKSSFEIRVDESIVFKINTTYPFHPPRLEISGVEYLAYLIRIQRKLKGLEKYGIKVKCPCCSSVNCSWSPCNTMVHVLKDYTDYRHYFSILYKFSLMKNVFDPLILDHILKYLHPI